MDIDQLKTLLDDRLKSFPGVLTTSDGETVWIGTTAMPKAIHLHFGSDDHVSIATDDGHFHAENGQQALDVAVGLLQGKARFTCEFRSDTLVAQWTEISRGDYFEEIGTSAIFVAYIDSDEWVLWPGEEWRQVRSAPIYADGKIENFSQEIRVANPRSGSSDWFLEWLEPAPPGLKWTVSASAPWLFYLAPKGWRESGKGDNHRDMVGLENGHHLLRSQVYYREPANPRPQRAGPIHAHTIDFTEFAAEDGWSKCAWSLVFATSETDVLAVQEFYVPAGDESQVRGLQTRLHDHIAKTVYIEPS